jgi:DNA-binding CsgD family transcriptional regulator
MFRQRRGTDDALLTSRLPGRRCVTDTPVDDHEAAYVSPGSELPPSLRVATDTLRSNRGHVLQLRRAFDRSQIPMLIVDNERRYKEANAAARLIFRMSLRELRENRIDDLTAEEDRPGMEEAWAELFERGSVSGRYFVTFKDASTLWVFYAALANVLPGQHLIVFVPADWPGDELEEMQPDVREEVRGPLSPRQLDVLRLVALGANAAKIATELSISEATVRTHVKNVLERLGAQNRAHAVALAMASGLLGENPPQLS